MRCEHCNEWFFFYNSWFDHLMDHAMIKFFEHLQKEREKREMKDYREMGKEFAKDWNEFRHAFLNNLDSNLSNEAYVASVEMAARWFDKNWRR